MIRYLIDFALRNRIFVLSVAVVLFVWGVISFHNLPIEAYPDVADTYTQIITQWPGHAAEEVEQQITVPLEVQLNGVAHMTHLRSVSLAGLSVITIIYDDETTTLNARQEVIDRLQQVTLPQGVNAGLGPDFSPTGQIMFYTLQSTNPRYDAMELKTLNDWYVVNQLKSVPNVVDVNPFGGPTREYQVQIDPGKLVSYGLSLSQVEQALAANNTNAGGGFIERGEQALNVRAVGLMQTTDDIAATVVKVQNGTPVRVRDLALVVQAPKVRLGQLGKTIRHEDGTIINDDDAVEGIVLLRKGAEAHVQKSFSSFALFFFYLVGWQYGCTGAARICFFGWVSTYSSHRSSRFGSKPNGADQRQLQPQRQRDIERPPLLCAAQFPYAGEFGACRTAYRRRKIQGCRPRIVRSNPVRMVRISLWYQPG